MGDWDPNAGLFDEDDELGEEDREDFTPGRELLVYLIDSGEDMLMPMGPPDEEAKGGSQKSYLEAVLECIAEDLKARIISRDADMVGLVLFNTREKKNIQESEGVFVLSELTSPSAQLITNVASLPGRLESEIGSRNWLGPDSRENPLYNALWVAQAMFRTGPATRVAKRIMLFTNNDDPFGDADPLTKADMRRTTIQRAKDAQDLGIEIELFPLSRPGEEFNVRIFYADMIQIGEDDDKSFMSTAAQRLEDLKTRMKKRTYRKRMVRRVALTLGDGVEIGMRSYAMIRTARIAKDVYVDAKNNVPLKTESSLICQDTGAVLTATTVKRMLPYGSSRILFTRDELSDVKKVTSADLQLIGFKPLSCLRDYHNLSPPTFLYPDDQAVKGSMCAAIALHTAMLNMGRMAMACWGKTTSPRLVALIAQKEEVEEGFQIVPPGFQMIFLPYFDDIREPEEYHPWPSGQAPRASEFQAKEATRLVHKLNLKDFSMLDIQNPALQTHYAILQAIALQEETIPDVHDDTMPDYKAMTEPSVQSAVKIFKDLVFGADFDAKQNAAQATAADKGLKRKAKEDAAAEKVAKIEWNQLADGGKLGTLTNEDLKDFLRSKGLPLSGNKKDLILRVLQALGK